MTVMVKKQSILETLRELLAFKATTTIAEIASYSGYSRRHVLAVLNRNSSFVTRDRKSGRISSVDVRSPLAKAEWDSGRFYKVTTFGMFSVEGHCLHFIDRDGVFERLAISRAIGAFGDSSTTRIVLDTPENRAALEAAGYRPWSEAVIDDRLWTEDINKPLNGE